MKKAAVITIILIMILFLFGCAKELDLESYDSYDIADFATLYIPKEIAHGEMATLLYHYNEDGKVIESELAVVFYEDYLIRKDEGFLYIYNEALGEVLLYDLGERISFVSVSKINTDLNLYPQFDFSEDVQFLRGFSEDNAVITIQFNGEELFLHKLSGEKSLEGDDKQVNHTFSETEDGSVVQIKRGNTDIEIKIEDVYDGALNSELYDNLDDFSFYRVAALNNDILVLTIAPTDVVFRYYDPSLTDMKVDYYYNLETKEIVYTKGGYNARYPLASGFAYISNTVLDSELIGFEDGKVAVSALYAEDGFHSDNIIVSDDLGFLAVNIDNKHIDIYDCRVDIEFSERISIEHLNLSDKIFSFKDDCYFDENNDIVVGFSESVEIDF